MTASKHQRIAAWITIAIVATFVCASVAAIAVAQEPEHPAFGSSHVSTLEVESDIDDTPAARKRLEDKAIAILREPGTVTGEKMTLAEARAITRIDGRVNVARCKEIVITKALRVIVQMRVTGVRVGNPNPSQEASP